MRPPWFMIVCLSACSPYSYSTEVAGISAGVDQLSAGFTAGYAALADDRATNLRFRLTSTHGKPAVASSCDMSDTHSAAGQRPCVLYPVSDPRPEPLPIEQNQAKIKTALTALRDYAHALAAVTNADDRTAFDKAVGQLSGSVGALAKTADAAAPGLSTVAPAAVDLLGWVVGTALDNQRFTCLKAAVNKANTPAQPGQDTAFHTVVATLGLGLQDLAGARRNALMERADAMMKGIGPKLDDFAYRQQLGDLQAVVDLLKGLHESDPAAAAKGLQAAHDALVAAVNDPATQHAALVKAVGDFADKASALRTALAAKAAAGSNAAKGS